MRVAAAHGPGVLANLAGPPRVGVSDVVACTAGKAPAHGPLKAYSDPGAHGGNTGAIHSNTGRRLRAPWNARGVNGRRDWRSCSALRGNRVLTKPYILQRCERTNPLYYGRKRSSGRRFRLVTQERARDRDHTEGSSCPCRWTKQLALLNGRAAVPGEPPQNLQTYVVFRAGRVSHWIASPRSRNTANGTSSRLATASTKWEILYCAPPRTSERQPETESESLGEQALLWSAIYTPVLTCGIRWPTGGSTGNSV